MEREHTERIFHTDSPSYPPPQRKHRAKSLPVPRGITPTLGWWVNGLRSKKNPGFFGKFRRHDRNCFTERVQDPTDSPVTSTDNDPDVRNVSKHLQAGRRSTRFGQVVNLSRVQEVLALPEDLGPLPAAGFGVDKDQQRVCVLQRSDLERVGAVVRLIRDTVRPVPVAAAASTRPRLGERMLAVQDGWTDGYWWQNVSAISAQVTFCADVSRAPIMQLENRGIFKRGFEEPQTLPDS